MPQRFEAKIYSIEDSNDLLTPSIAELTHKLHAQEQKYITKGHQYHKGGTGSFTKEF